MAAVPMFLLLGDEQINGQPLASLQRPPTELPALWGGFRNYYKLNRVVPGGTLAAATYNPYWDGSFNSGAGAFVPFHHANATLVPGAKGDNWYEIGGGITPASLLMNAIEELYPSSPGFRFLKQAQPGGFGSGTNPWRPAGSGWTNFLAVWSNVTNALTLEGNTPDVKNVIVDLATTDIVNINLLFKTHAQEFITGIRTTISSTCLITLVMPHPFLFNATLAAVVQGVRSACKELQAENANVRVFDMNWGTLAPESLLNPLAPTNVGYYDTETYVQSGARMARLYDAWTTGLPTPSAGGGIPCVAMICDSQGVTIPVNNAMTVFGGGASLLGNGVGSTERTGEWIWNKLAEEVQLYDILANTNTFGDVLPWTGPESTLLRTLKRRFPNGVVLFKYAKGGVSLTAEGLTAGSTGAVEQDAANVWPQIVEQWTLFREAVYRDTGCTPDMQGVLVLLGDNDTISQAATDALPSAASTFIDDIRELMTTRTTGPELPVVWLQPPPALGSAGVVGGSSLGPAARRASIRSAISTLEDTKERVKVLLNSGSLQYELGKNENVHYCGEATWRIGEDAANALVALIDSEEGETADDSEASFPSESAAFIVETGSGLTDANSYCSLAFANTYHDSYDNPEEWRTASDAAKQNALRYATRAADERYGLVWGGQKLTSEQALDWPQGGAWDSAGNAIGDDTIPLRLQQWVARAALLRMQGFDLMPQQQETAAIVAESRSYPGGLSKSITYQSGGKPATDQFPALDRMLASAGIITSTGAGWGTALV